MKLTNEEILYAGQAIQTLGREKLPINISLQMAKLTHKLLKATKPLNKQRKAITSKYNHQAEKDEKNQPKPLSAEQRELMEAEDEALLETEVEFDFESKDKIKLPQKVPAIGAKLGELEDYKIDANTLALLLPFIEV